MRTQKSYKQILIEANRYEDIINILKDIIDLKNRSFAVRLYLDKENHSVMNEVDGCLVRSEAAYVLRMIEDEMSINPNNILYLDKYVEEYTNTLLHNYSVNLSHNNTPTIGIESIKCFLILNNMLDCLELENDDDYSGWYIPDTWKKNPDDTKVMDNDEKSATITTFKEEIKVQDLIDEFEAMAKRGTLLTGSGVTQQDILIQILGVITVVAMKN